MRYLMALILAAFIATPAMAAFEGGPGSRGGFSGPVGGVNETTVDKARAMADNIRVVLTGNIISQVGKDDYMFKDATGEIKVEIDRKVFGDLTVKPENTVRIFGKVDNDFGKGVEIDVKRIEIVK